MSPIPQTSVTLLKDLSGDASSVRWTEFFNRYESAMRGFLQSRYPMVEADDVLQETLLALVKCLPRYHYLPDEHGHFRNYLMGIVKHKAEDALRRQAKESNTRAGFGEYVRHVPPETGGDDEAEWKSAALQTAVEQLLSDDSIAPRNREVFRHVALMHEPPENVAAQFGITRNNVDQIKRRLLDRLSKSVAAMTSDS